MKTKLMQITEQNKYNTKDICLWIRQTLKPMFPDLKFSIRCEYYSGGSAIHLTVLESKNVRFVRRPDEVTQREIVGLMAGRNDSEENIKRYVEEQQKSTNFQVNEHYIVSSWHFTEKGKELLSQIVKIAQKYNHDNSDAMTDYFDVNYYLHVNLGTWEKPFIDGKM